jgi:hypothetical protein
LLERLECLSVPLDRHAIDARDDVARPQINALPELRWAKSNDSKALESMVHQAFLYLDPAQKRT